MIIKQAPKSNIECSTLLGSKYKQAVRLWRRGRISRYDYKIYGGVEWWIINNSWNLTLHFPTRLICWPKDLIWFSNDFQILAKEKQEKRNIFCCTMTRKFSKTQKNKLESFSFIDCWTPWKRRTTNGFYFDGNLNLVFDFKIWLITNKAQKKKLYN